MGQGLENQNPNLDCWAQNPRTSVAVSLHELNMTPVCHFDAFPDKGGFYFWVPTYTQPCSQALMTQADSDFDHTQSFFVGKMQSELIL